MSDSSGSLQELNFSDVDSEDEIVQVCTDAYEAYATKQQVDTSGFSKHCTHITGLDVQPIKGSIEDQDYHYRNMMRWAFTNVNRKEGLFLVEMQKYMSGLGIKHTNALFATLIGRNKLMAIVSSQLGEQFACWWSGFTRFNITTLESTARHIFTAISISCRVYERFAEICPYFGKAIFINRYTAAPYVQVAALEWFPVFNKTNPIKDPHDNLPDILRYERIPWGYEFIPKDAIISALTNEGLQESSIHDFHVEELTYRSCMARHNIRLRQTEDLHTLLGDLEPASGGNPVFRKVSDKLFYVEDFQPNVETINLLLRELGCVEVSGISIEKQLETIVTNPAICSWLKAGLEVNDKDLPVVQAKMAAMLLVFDSYIPCNIMCVMHGVKVAVTQPFNPDQGIICFTCDSKLTGQFVSNHVKPEITIHEMIDSFLQKASEPFTPVIYRNTNFAPTGKVYVKLIIGNDTSAVNMIQGQGGLYEFPSDVMSSTDLNSKETAMRIMKSGFGISAPEEALVLMRSTTIAVEKHYYVLAMNRYLTAWKPILTSQRTNVRRVYQYEETFSVDGSTNADFRMDDRRALEEYFNHRAQLLTMSAAGWPEHQLLDPDISDASSTSSVTDSGLIDEVAVGARQMAERFVTETGIASNVKVFVVSSFANGLVSLVTGIYHLVRDLQKSETTWLDYTVTVVQISSAITTTALQIVSLLNLKANMPNITRRVFQILEHFSSFAPASDKDPMFHATVIKLVAITAATVIGSATGCNIRDVNTAISLGRTGADVTSDVVKMTGELLGFDLDGSQELSKAANAFIDDVAKFAAIPTSKFAGAKLRQLEESVEAMRSFAHKNLRKLPVNISQRFGIKLNQIETRLREIKETSASGKPKIAPVAIHLWSSQAGIGKNTVSKFIVDELAKKIDGFNNEIYTTEFSGKHWATYLSESTMRIDEVGATKDPAGSGPFFQTLNAVLGESTPVCPAASLEGKSQSINPYLVFTLANQDLKDIETGLKSTSSEALLSRIHSFEVIDQRFDKSGSRYIQHHRRPDFSHLQFRGSDGRCISVTDLTVFIMKCLKRHKAQYDALQTISGGPPLLTLPEPEFDYDPASAKDQNPVITILGREGTDKSRFVDSAVLPVFVQAGWSVIVGESADLHMELLSKIRAAEGKILVLLDDTYQLQDNSQQCKLEELIRLAPNNVGFLIIGNYGEIPSVTHPVLWKRAKYYHTPIKQGLSRRIGFVSNPEATLYVRHAGECLSLFNNDQFDSHREVARWEALLAGDKYLKVLKALPAPLPFTKKEADMWLEMDEQPKDTASMVRTMFRQGQVNLRIVKLLGDFPVDTPRERLRDEVIKYLQRCHKEIPNLKLYVRVEHRTYYLGFGAYFVGEIESAVWIDQEQPGNVYVEGKSIYITDAMFRDIFQPSEHHDLKEEQRFQTSMLRTEKTMNTSVWREISKTHAERIRALDSTPALSRFSTLTGFCYAGAVIGVAAAVAGSVFLIKKLAFDRKKKPSIKGIDVPMKPQCSQCSDEFSPYCPGHYSFQEASKGKGTKIKGYRIGGHTYMGSDIFDDNTPISRAAHDFTGHFRSKGWKGDNHHTIDYGNGYKYTGSFSQGEDGRTIDITFIGDFEPASKGKQPFDIVKTNVHRAVAWNQHGPIDSLYCFFVTHNLVRLPAHIFNDADYVAVGDGRLKPFVTYKDADTVWAYYVNDQGSIIQMPNAKDCRRLLIDENRISAAYNLTVVNPEDCSTHTGFGFQFKKVFTRPVTSKHVDWRIERDAAIVIAQISFPSWLKCGSCGHLAFVEVDGTWKILGQLNGLAASRTAAIYTVSTTDELFGVFTELNPASLGKDLDVCRAEFMSNCDDFEPWTFSRFADNLEEPIDTGYFGYESTKTVGSYPVLQGTVDQKSEKSPILGFKFAHVFGNLKAPAPSKENIELQYHDKIPPDKVGNKNAYNIRLNKAARANHKLPPEIVEELSVAATQLANEVRTQVDMAGTTPLTVEDSISGCSCIEPLDLTTSAGAAFRVLEPSVFKKSDCLSIKGQTPNPVQSRTMERINKQWEFWKNGKTLLVPSTISLKSETLPNEKRFKKRLVNVTSPIETVNIRRLLMPLQVKLAVMGPWNPAQLTMNPRVDFNRIFQTLQGYEQYAALDVSSFDLTAPWDLQKAFCLFCEVLYDAGPTLRKLLRSAVEVIALAPMIVDGNLVLRSAGVCSGVPCTSFVDSWQMAIVVRAAFIHHAKTRRIPSNVIRFNTTSRHGGDDTIIAWNKFLASLQDILDYFWRIGLETTSTSKDGESTASDTAFGLEFCSRKFLPIDDESRLVSARLKIESMSGMLCWSNSVDRVEIKNMLLEALGETLLYGRRKYEMLSALIASEFPSVKMLTYDEQKEELERQIVVAPFERDVKEITNTTHFTVPYVLDTPSAEFCSLSELDERLVKSCGGQRSVAWDRREILQRIKKAYPSFPESLEREINNFREKDPQVYKIKDGSETLSIPVPYTIAWFKMILGKHPHAQRLMRMDPPQTKKGQQIAALQQAMKAHYSDKFRPIMEMVDQGLLQFEPASAQEQITAAPPDAPVPQAGSSTTTGVTPVGVAPNELQSSAIAVVDPVRAVSGIVEAPVIIEPSGFVDGTFIAPSGAAQNILTLAGQKIFTRMVKVPMGVAEGFKIFEYEVDPWNPQILNKHALKWANLHRRCRGGHFYMHVDVISAATIAFNVKIAYIPKLYDKMVVNQANVDIFEPVSVACNQSGSGTVSMVVTATTTPLMGIIKGETSGAGGRVVCIAASNALNSYGSPMEVQIRLSFSLGPDVIYDIPLTASEDSGEILENTVSDIPPHVRVVLDGTHMDNIDYGVSTAAQHFDQQPNRDGIYYLDAVPEKLLTDTALSVNLGSEMSMLFGSVPRASILKRNPKEPEFQNLPTPAARKSLGDLDVVVGQSDKILTFVRQSNTATFNIPVALQNMVEQNTSTANTIRCINARFVPITAVDPAPKLHGVDFSGYYLDPALTTDTSDNAMQMIFPNTVYAYADGEERIVPIYSTKQNIRLKKGPYPSDVFDEISPSGVGFTRNDFSLHGTPVATSSATAGPVAPTGYAAVVLTENHDITPGVSPNIIGRTVCPGDANLNALRSVWSMIEKGGSIVTTFANAAGTAVFELIRNNKGIFIFNPESGSDYKFSKNQMASYTQSHSFKSAQFPAVLPYLDNVFQDRVVTSAVFDTLHFGKHVKGILDTPSYMEVARANNSNPSSRSWSVINSIESLDLSDFGPASFGAMLGLGAVGGLATGMQQSMMFSKQMQLENRKLDIQDRARNDNWLLTNKKLQNENYRFGKDLDLRGEYLNFQRSNAKSERELKKYLQQNELNFRQRLFDQKAFEASDTRYNSNVRNGRTVSLDDIRPTV